MSPLPPPGPRALLDPRDPLDNVFVQHAHVATRFFIAAADSSFQPSNHLAKQRVHFTPNILVDGSYFRTDAIDSRRYFLPNGRKFNAHVPPELQNLRLECCHASGQELKTFHFSFENFDSADQNCVRHAVALTRWMCHVRAGGTTVASSERRRKPGPSRARRTR